MSRVTKDEKRICDVCGETIRASIIDIFRITIPSWVKLEDGVRMLTRDFCSFTCANRFMGRVDAVIAAEAYDG